MGEQLFDLKCIKLRILSRIFITNQNELHGFGSIVNAFLSGININYAKREKRRYVPIKANCIDNKVQMKTYQYKVYVIFDFLSMC